MRIANLAGRLVILTGAGHGKATANGTGGTAGAVDVEHASDGVFGADPQAIYERWPEFTEWAATSDLTGAARAYDPRGLGAPAPAPRQILAMGFNYRGHAAELGTVVHLGLPPVFTKFVTSVGGPYGTVVLPDGSVDWEVELVAVLGRRAWQVAAEDAWQYVAGLTVGQDLSERETQMRGAVPQFSLGKSFPGFAPMGPWLVTPDELADPDDLRLTCVLNGETVQDGRTSQLITPLPEIIARLSAILPLLPGDVIYTGTPSGVGMGRDPRRFLAPGDELVSSIEGIGEMRHVMAAAVADDDHYHL